MTARDVRRVRPDTPTADAPADTDLRIALARALCDDEHELPGLCVSGYAQADKVLPLVRAQVEAARRDGWDEGWDEGHQWTMFKRGLEREANPYRAARGETRQP